ncbi:hypothetical protein QBC46DRAFT_343228 [Diplogelasinospora grovesii]|uniref:Uncharacterized protein n=1 Tax=Diplogelasinospora grovesii TaxID=303347 RepID=A0AAN6S3R0_9PEZI|nr:hypothetical protein QBC46DRAFT_343228 [Diplogelasinospora grovesii]
MTVVFVQAPVSVVFGDGVFGAKVGHFGCSERHNVGDSSICRRFELCRSEDMDLSDTTQPLDKDDESDKKKRLKRNRKTLKCLAVKTRETRPFLSRAPVPLRRSASPYGDLCDPDFTPEWEGAAGSILSASPDPDTVAKLRNLYDKLMTPWACRTRCRGDEHRHAWGHVVQDMREVGARETA